MVRRLIEVGREEGLEQMVAEILGANGGMVRICEELGFTITADEEGETVQASLTL
jgi:acetyltransferase